MTGIQWESISLEGFGPYANKTTVSLTEGLNLLAAPNETGKSTLVEGLRAVLFGLPNSNDPKKFGTARFRSWGGAEIFEGEVCFLVNGARYRIKRQFDKHKVLVSREEKHGWVTELETEHNPAATRGAGDYQSYIGDLLGLTNDQIFIDTFYLTQPLPELGNLSDELKTLLSGSGGNFANALKILEDSLAKQTRFLRDMGFSSNKRNDRELEKVEAEILKLEKEIQDAKDQADELQPVLIEIEKVAAKLKENKKNFQRKKQLQEAWEKGRQLRGKYTESLEKQVDINRAKDELWELEKNIEKIKRKLETSFAHFLNLPWQFEEDLEQLIKWEEEIFRLKGTIKVLEDELIEQKDEFYRISGDLEKLSHFQNNLHLVADLKELKKLSEKRNREIEARINLLEKLKGHRQIEESKEHKNKILWQRLGIALSVSVAMAIGGWPIANLMGVLMGFLLGAISGWGLSYVILGSNKKALAIPETKEALAAIASLDPELGEFCKLLKAVEMEMLTANLYLLLKGNGLQEMIKLSSKEFAGFEAFTFLAKIEEEQEELRDRIAPYDLETSLDIVEQDFETYQNLTNGLSVAKSLVLQTEKRLENNTTAQAAFIETFKELKAGYPFLLESQFNDLKKIKENWQSFNRLKGEQDGLIKKIEGLLSGVSAKDKNELHSKHTEMQNKVIGIQRELAELEKAHPGLPSFIDSKKTEWQELEETYRNLEREVKNLENQGEELFEEQQALKLKQIELEGKGLINIAQGELELAELKTKKKAIQFEIDALEIAYQELKEAITNFNHSYRERLAKETTHYFREFTDTNRTINITDDFEVRVLAEGQERQAHQFSQGTRDQLFFALRLAVGDLLAADFQLPFILDDPFLNYDQTRLKEAKRILTALSEERQIFLLTHREDLVAWGNQVTIEKE